MHNRITSYFLKFAEVVTLKLAMFVFFYFNSIDSIDRKSVLMFTTDTSHVNDPQNFTLSMSLNY